MGGRDGRCVVNWSEKVEAEKAPKASAQESFLGSLGVTP
jgi:hypothetical protein